MQAIFLVLSLGVVQVFGDVSELGYHYQPPITSYEAPFSSVDRKYFQVGLNPIGHEAGGSFERQYYDVQQPGPVTVPTPTTERQYYHIEKQAFSGGNVAAVPPSPQLQIPIHEHSPFVQPTGEHRVILQKVPKLKLPQQTVPLPETLTNTLEQTSFNVQNTGENIGFEQKSSFGGGAVDVQKHLYFFTAPEETEEIKPRIIYPPASAKKNVRILFIKTPTFKTAPITIPAVGQNEDKTLVYVLVKRPEEAQIAISEEAPAKPAKPEVFFIKYKTQEEAQEAISKVHQNVQAGVPASESESTFFRNEQLVPQVVAKNQAVTVVSEVTTPLPSLHVSQESFSTEAIPALKPQLPVSPFISGQRINLQQVPGGSSGIMFTSAPGFGSTTTISPLNVPGLNVHQVYGPPQRR